MVISLVYYAVSFSAGTFGGNRYLVFFLTSLVEIPSNWTCIVLCRRYVCKHEKQFTQSIQFEKFLMKSFQRINNYQTQGWNVKDKHGVLIKVCLLSSVCSLPLAITGIEN